MYLLTLNTFYPYTSEDQLASIMSYDISLYSTGSILHRINKLLSFSLYLVENILKYLRLNHNQGPGLLEISLKN